MLPQEGEHSESKCLVYNIACGKVVTFCPCFFDCNDVEERILNVLNGDL